MTHKKTMRGLASLICGAALVGGVVLMGGASHANAADYFQINSGVYGRVNVVGEEIMQTTMVVGANPTTAVSWKIDGVPEGIAIDTSGPDGPVLSGKPTAAGVYTTTVTATGDNGAKDTKSFAWVVKDSVDKPGITNECSVGVFNDLNENGVRDAGEEWLPFSLSKMSNDGDPLRLPPPIAWIDEKRPFMGPHQCGTSDALVLPTFGLYVTDSIKPAEGYEWVPTNGLGITTQDIVNGRSAVMWGGDAATSKLEAGYVLKPKKPATFPTITISGTVQDETTGNGVLDLADPPVEGVTVGLVYLGDPAADISTGTPALDESGNPIDPVVTGPDGSYTFHPQRLASTDSGTYAIVILGVPPTYTDTEQSWQTTHLLAPVDEDSTGLGLVVGKAGAVYGGVSSEEVPPVTDNTTTDSNSGSIDNTSNSTRPGLAHAGATSDSTTNGVGLVLGLSSIAAGVAILRKKD